MNEDELIQSMNVRTVNHNGDRHLVSVPITLDICKQTKDRIGNHKQVVLTWRDDVVAVVENPEIYPNRKEEICTKTFGTRSLKH